MPVQHLAPPVWVNAPQLLKQMTADLSLQKQVAVDTESNSLHAYREQVCLVQFSTPKTDYLVDPLELNDLSLLAPMFASPKIEKIFHAAEYDLICLRRDFAFEFSYLFDTMQAARILGYSAVGLDKLLGDKFGVEVDKRHQKADWASRPLTEEQIHYARLDTHYLIGLRDVLEKELREKNRWQLAYEDFRRACETDTSNNLKTTNDAFGRFNGRKDVTLRELTILSELCAWREAIAEKMDRPPFKVLMDDVLIELARSVPGHLEDLAGIGLSQKQIKLWGGEILKAVQRGTEAPLVKRKQVERQEDAVLRRLDKLKTWRKKVAAQMGVESDIVLPKAYLSVLAENPPKNGRELEVAMRDLPWRVEQFGGQILKLLGGKDAN